MPRSLYGSVSWQAAWQAPWQANCHGDMGGGVAIQRASMWHATCALTAGVVRVFGTRPDDPSRASGEGTDGSDPPFLTADAASCGGGCGIRCGIGCGTPTLPASGGRSRPIYPSGKAGRPASWPDEPERRAAR